MMLLNAAAAGFAALAAIPIIIHLLNKRRFKIIDWAATQFLLKTLQKNSRRLQLRDVILLALRTAALALVALAAARPTMSSGSLAALGGGGVRCVVVLDNSQSMGCLDGGDTRFATAKRRARAMIEHLPKGSRAALILMSDAPQVEVSEPSLDLDFVSAAIDKAPLGDGGTNVLASLAKAWDMLKHADGPREILLDTDMQANAWPAAEERAWQALRAEIASHRDVSLLIADAARTPVADLSVDRLEPVDPLVMAGKDCAFAVTVRNHPLAAADAVPHVQVDLETDDGDGTELRTVASTVIDHLAGAETVRLTTRFRSGGRHRVAARIGPDRLAADNARYLALDVIDHLRVLIVDGSAQGGYEGGAGFIRAALSPGSGGDGGDGGDREQGGIVAEIATPSELAGSALDRFQAVVLNDVPEISAKLADGLKSYVTSGGGLLVVLGADVRSEAYNAQLGLRTGLLPARIGPAPIACAPPDGGRSSGDAPVGIGFSTAGLGHPIVNFFRAKDTQPFLAQPRFFQAFALDPPAAADPAGGPGAGRKDAAMVVIRFADGKPALVERGIGDGSVLLFASSAAKAWSDFALRPAFLMLVRRAVLHLALSSRRSGTIGVNEPIRVVLPAAAAGERFTVLDPRGGSSTIACELSVDGRNAVAEQVDTPFAGFYTLRSQMGDSPAQIVAANAPSEEAVLDALGEDALRTLCQGMDWHRIGVDDDIVGMAAHARSGWEFWPELLIAALGCMVAESILASLWAPRGA